MFREIQSLRKKRAKAEKNKFKQERIKESKLLKKLRNQRIKQEGRSLLQKQIAIEKARIARAKKPTKLSKIEGFLARKVKKAAPSIEKALSKEAKKRLARIRAGKPVFGKGTRKKRRRKKKR